MTSPRQQTDAQLAAIAERANYLPIWTNTQISAAREYGAKASADRHALLAHIAWQAERIGMIQDARDEYYETWHKYSAELAAAQATIAKQRSRIGDLWGTLNEHQWGCRCEGYDLCPACGLRTTTKEGQHAKSCDIARALATPDQEAADG